MSKLPLAGMRVVEFGQIVSAPTAGLIFGDMGADVIKVEPVDAGTPTRPNNIRNGSFYYFNRNKRGLAVNIATPEGLEVARRLVKQADVVIENMAPGTMDRLGLGYAKASELNPRVVYCSIKGFLTGPYSSRTLMDEPGQMASGLAYMTGLPDKPLRAGASVVDMGAATYAVIGVMAALLEREKTGKGQHITSGLFETALFYVGQHMSNAQLTGEDPLPMSTARNVKGGRTAIYDLFKCKGGKQVFIGIMSDPQWLRACAALGLDDLAADPGLKLNAGRGAQRNMLMERIGKAVANRDADEVVDALVAAGVTVAPLNTPVTVMDDRHVKSDGRMLPVQIGARLGRLPPLPFESSEYQFGMRHHAPAETGKDSSEILRELGYSTEEITALAGKGLVRGPGLPAGAADKPA
jgi:crotonobetainyl-CoA:carnitine CoA-transferase CaiB-like acyl-CoA transferase